MNSLIKIQKINKRSDLTKAEVEEGSGAILLRASWYGRIPGHSKKTVNTGISIDIPEDCVGLITNHTSLVKNYPLTLIEQTWDSSLREEIKVEIINYTPYPENINYNQIIGKILIVPKTNTSLKYVAKLKKTTAGE